MIGGPAGVLAAMPEGQLIATLLAYYSVLGAITALVARARGRHWLVWFFLGIVMNPVIAVPLLLVFRRGDATPEENQASSRRSG